MNRHTWLGITLGLAACQGQETPSPPAPRIAALPDHVMQQALETVRSGEALTWQVSGDGPRGTVTPIRTFRTNEGYCREFKVTLGQPGGSSWQAIACRDAAGVWRTFEVGA